MQVVNEAYWMKRNVFSSEDSERETMQELPAKPIRGFGFRKIVPRKVFKVRRMPSRRWQRVRKEAAEVTIQAKMQSVAGVADEKAMARALYGERVENNKFDDSLKDKTEKTSRWAVSPKNRWRSCWDTIQAFILIWLAVEVPIRVGFDEQATGGFYVWSLAMDAYFWIDIVLNFFFAYEDGEGRVISDLKTIRVNYLEGWFFLDVLASLPIDMVMKIRDGRFGCSIDANCVETTSAATGQMVRLVKLLRMFRLVKMLRLVRLQRILDRYQDDLFEFMSCINICKLFSMLIFLGHILGCFFYFFSTEEWRSPAESDTVALGLKSVWLDSNFPLGLDQHTISEKYVTAQYWAFTTMTTVGYGDISATTMAERSYGIFGMLVGGFAFSALIGSISAIATKLEPSKAAAKLKIDYVSSFVTDVGLPSQLRSRVMLFFRRQDVRAYNERALLEQMPFSERKDVLQFCYGRRLAKMPVFKDADPLFLMEVLQCMVPLSVPAGGVVVHKQEVNCGMYFLQQGMVEVDKDDDSDTIEILLHAPTFFGEGCVLGETQSTDNFRAITNSKVLQVQFSDMSRILARFPEIREGIRSIWLKRKEKGVLSGDGATIPVPSSLQSPQSPRPMPMQKAVENQLRHVQERKRRLVRLEEDFETALKLAHMWVGGDEDGPPSSSASACSANAAAVIEYGS